MNSEGKKAKGREFQKEVRDFFLNLCPAGQFESQAMGRAGTDVPDPHSLLPWTYTECRRWDSRWPTLTDIVHEMRKVGSGRWTFVIRRSRAKPVWVIPHNIMTDLLTSWFGRGTP